MAKRREVFLQGKFLTFDRSNAFQLSSANIRASKNRRKLAASPSQTRSSEKVLMGYSSDSDSSTEGPELEGSEEHQELATRVEEQIRSKKQPAMQRTVSLGIVPRVRGTDHASVARQRLALSASGRMIKTFINTAIDPHVLKINPDGTIMISDETLAGSEFGPLVNSLTSSKDFVIGESEVLAIVLKHATQRIKKMLVPSKRKRRYQGPKTMGKSLVAGAAGTAITEPEIRSEKPVGSSALMGHVAPPIQKKPLAVETRLVSPAVNIKKNNTKWYHL